MGFRNPITTAIDPIARASADAAGNDAARALTEIIPGSRIAVDALDFKTAVGMTISSASIIGSTVRATGSGDVTPSSANHGLQVGPTSGSNLAMDGNEIMGRAAGVGVAVFSQFGWTSGPIDYPTATPGTLTRRDYVDGKFTGPANVTITPASPWTGTFYARTVTAGPFTLVEVRADLSGGSAASGAFVSLGSLPASIRAPASLNARGAGLAGSSLSVHSYVTTAGTVGFVNDTGAVRSTITFTVVYLA